MDGTDIWTKFPRIILPHAEIYFEGASSRLSFMRVYSFMAEVSFDDSLSRLGFH